MRTKHLTVDASSAGATVACPKCGQAIIIPQMAGIVVTTEKPTQMKRVLVAAGLGVVLLLAVGALI